MKLSDFFTLTLGLCAAVLPLANPRAADANSPDPNANETIEQRDARMEWWREARFGMFMHWGAIPKSGCGSPRTPA
jgi:alpha-L-fucosidase